MIGRAIDRVVGRLPFSLRKHYVHPLLRRLRSPALYGRAYDDETFWRSFYRVASPGDDRSTIGHDFPARDAAFHYNAVENGILALLHGEGLVPGRVLDVGSGAGHWVDFYTRLYPVEKLVGVDISQEAVHRLRERFGGLPSASFARGHVGDLDLSDSAPFDLVSCIGVLFHIVEDERWRQTLERLHGWLRPGGVLIASDLFGPFSANVQFDPEEFSSASELESEPAELACNKRVRSRRLWKKELRRLGFRKLVFHRTAKARGMGSPENNLLLAVR